MATNSASFDSRSRSVHEYSDMRRRENCEMLNKPNDEIAQLNRHSTNREYIEMDDMPSDHQYERVRYSTIEQNEDKSKVKLGVIKQVFIIVLVAVIIVAVVLLCLIFVIYILNMLSGHKDLSKESNSKNKSDSSTTMPFNTSTVAFNFGKTIFSKSDFSITIPTTSSTVASTSRQKIISKTVSSIKSTTTQTVWPITIQKKGNAVDEKLKFVKEMMLDSWNAYERYAWGHGEVSPVSKKAYDGYFGNNSGLTLVTSMSTLWIMGLKDEFNRGKQWIETELDLSKVNEDVQVFDVIVNYVGGLLSCFALTNEQLFMNKALTIAQLVEPAFNTLTGLTHEKINLKTNKLSYSDPYLSDVSGFRLDFNYLSDASGNDKYRKQIEKIHNVLKEMGKPKNLYFRLITIEGRWFSDYSSLFILSREFYISLVKSYIQSNHLDVQSIEMYKEAMDAVEEVKMFEVSNGGLYYAIKYHSRYNSLDKYLQYSGCYLGAMLSLGASAMQRALALNSSIGVKDKVTQQNRINRHWHLAIQITRTCQLASDKTETGLGPDEFYFNETHDVISKYGLYYFLSPELAESNFILWRLTHNETYRDSAWKMAQAIHQHCKVQGGGYAFINNVNKVPTFKHGYQPAEFLSATLKYLYLTFTSDSVLPLDQWVFNSRGHPLPICGNNTMYPAKLCKH